MKPKKPKPRYLGTSPLEQSTIDSIGRLKDGRSLTLTFSQSSDTTIRTYRNKIYAYLNKLGIKQYFRLYLEGESEIPNILRIKRLGQQFKTDFLSSSEENRIANWVFENLLDFESIEDSDKVMLIIVKAIEEKNLSEGDILKAHERWKESILGIDETPTEKNRSKTGLEALEQTLEQDKNKAKDGFSEGFKAVTSKGEIKS